MSDKIKLLKAKDIAEILGISLHTAYEVIHNKSLPSMKIGGRYYVEESKFYTWIMDEKNNSLYR
ncbi:helix-turn-helix domain-containing protein [Alkalihalobacillus trypoxylicola]|uniref:Helix-turn-helix domain-containing protein n=1 Tax=Alkalihalobacillus trypoxylicola TaxID=519424 RepID=A0A162F6I2_9BACI|nr:helix-turn-helix domain-containing protein [Alkalihalobacillus trypoxylicola]KYG34898.1 hypothetical protein AZF04_00770 [Alkalihalobacillus trypoxylicola]